jgi:hypothetical protein
LLFKKKNPDMLITTLSHARINASAVTKPRCAFLTILTFLLSYFLAAAKEELLGSMIFYQARSFPSGETLKAMNFLALIFINYIPSAL